MRHAALLIAITLSLPARAGPALDSAREAYAALEYERCRGQAKGALEEPATRDERIDAYRLLGLCHAALGDTEPARDAFIRMLAIDPEARLPEGLSPRFTSSYLEAKGYWVGEKPLSLSIARSRVEEGLRVVLLEVHDPMGQVEKVSWRGAEDFDELSPGLKVAPRMELELPDGKPVEIVALDAHQGEIATLAVGVPEPPKVAERPDETPKDPETAEDPGAGSELWTWVAVGAGTSVLVAGAAAAGLGLYLYQPREVSLRSEVVFGDQK